MNWEDLDQRVLTIAKVVALFGMVAAIVGQFVGIQFSEAMLGLIGTVLLALLTASAVQKGKQDTEDKDE